MKELFHSLVSLLQTLIYGSLFGCLLVIMFLHGMYRDQYPVYDNIKCIVIDSGMYASRYAPKSFITIRMVDDSTKTTVLHSANYREFTDFKYKIGDTLHFKWLLKSRFTH